MRHKHGYRFGIKMVLMVILAAFLFTYVVMYLWNAVLVPVLELNEISFWQAMGILILSKILFGGKGKGGHYKRCHKHKWKEKYHNLSDDEKQKMKGFFEQFKEEKEANSNDQSE